MSNKIIMVTRINIQNFSDEWTAIWGLDQEKEISYVNNDGLHYDKPSSYDITLIHGSFYKENMAALKSKIKLDDNYEGTIIRIHYGGGQEPSALKNNDVYDFGFYSTSANEEQYREIADKFKKNKYENAKKTLLQLLQIKKTPIECLSLLKHRIAHLFLSLDIDLQGIADVKKDDKVNYLGDVLNKKPDTYYRQQLVDLQFMVAKVSDNNPFIKEELLTDGKSIKELIADKKDEVQDLWKLLLALSGLEEKDDKVIISKSLEIHEFVVMMDQKTTKVNQGDVNEVLDFFKKDEGWSVKGANPTPILSFHDWFCALDDCLDKLREAMK